MKRKITIILTLVLVLTLSLLLCGCEAKLEDKDVALNDYFTDVRITSDGVTMTGEEAKTEFDNMIKGESELKGKKITIITLAVNSSASFNEMNIKYSGATIDNVTAYYYNNAVVEKPSDFDKFTEKEKENFLNKNCKKELIATIVDDKITLNADNLDLKPASAEGTSSYITIELNYDEAGINIDSIDGKIIEKVQPLGSKVLSALELMGYGMLSIFVVIILIIITVVILNKVTNRKKKEENNESQTNE